jgi:integrase/recombinase XerD
MLPPETLASAIYEWEKYAKNKHSSKTFKIYKRRLREFLLHFGNIALNKLTKQSIAEYIGNIKSPSVRSQVIASYTSLVKFLRDFYDIILPSVPEFVKVKEKKPLPKPLSEEVVFKMLRLASEKREKWKLAAITLMAFAGLRASEVLSVKPESFFKDSNGNIWVRIRGKGDKERVIPLPKNKYTEWTWENREKVFPILITYQSLYETIRKLGKRAGDENATPHRLRHFYGTYLSSKGVPVQVIQELMGHSNPKTTMNYVKVSNREKIEAVK